MRRTLIAAAAVSAATLASSAFAGFTFSSTDQGVISGYQVFLIRAINDGNGTGTELDGYDMTWTMNPGVTAHFAVIDSDFDGTGDTADLINTGNSGAGFQRVGAFGTTSIVATTPSLGPTQPNPWDAISTWQIAAISTGSENATGAGAVIGRLFLSGANAGGDLTGQIGGNNGDAVPVSYHFGAGVGPGDTTDPVVTVNPADVTVDLASASSFGPVAVSATDNVGVTSLTAGTVPATISDNVSITGSSTGPLSVSGSGLTTADLGDWTINFTALDAAGNDAFGVFSLHVVNTNVPEPTTLAALAGVSMLALRRRK